MERQNWKRLYAEAIVTSKGAMITQHITDAEKAIAERARELFRTNGSEYDEEKEALDDALYALHALKSAMHNYSGSHVRLRYGR